jgi:hypothetical protein
MYDHKALLFDKKRSLLGFPISVTEQKVDEDWPSEVFQGAHLYKISLVDGFQRQAAITHQESSADWHHHIQRLLTIGDQLYTLSESRVQANDLTNFKKTGVLDFAIEEPPVCVVPQIGEEVVGNMPSDCPIVMDPPIAIEPLLLTAPVEKVIQ